MNADSEEPPAVQKLPECFKGLGKLKGYQVKIHVDENVAPVVQNPRRILFSLREKVDGKLQQLVEIDVIEPVDGPTPGLVPLSSSRNQMVKFDYVSI